MSCVFPSAIVRWNFPTRSFSVAPKRSASPRYWKHGHVIVGETDQAGLTLTLMREDPLEPQVEPVMKVDVGQDRRNWAPLEHPLLRPHDPAMDHGSCPQPFLDQPQDHRVADPKPEHLHQPRMVEMVEEPMDVGFKDVIHAAFEGVLAQPPQGLVRITPGPISVGHIQEVRFVDRFENPRHGSLQQPVLRRGHGRGKLRDRSIAFRTSSSSLIRFIH